MILLPSRNGKAVTLRVSVLEPGRCYFVSRTVVISLESMLKMSGTLSVVGA